MALTQRFVGDISSFDEAYNAGSALFVGSYEQSGGEEPPLYELTVSTAGAAGDVTLEVQLTGLTIDGIPVAAPALPEEVTLREGFILYFSNDGVTYQRAELLEESTISALAPSLVNVEPLELAIAAGDVANVFNMKEICSITELPIASDSQTVNATILKNGIQGSDVKTRTNLKIAVQLISAPNDVAQQAIILPASQSTEDIFSVAVKSSGYLAWGASKVTNFSLTGGIEELERPSFTLDYQSPFALAFASSNPEINTPEQIADIETLFRYIGIDDVLN